MELAPDASCLICRKCGSMRELPRHAQRNPEYAALIADGATKSHRCRYYGNRKDKPKQQATKTHVDRWKELFADVKQELEAVAKETHDGHKD